MGKCLFSIHFKTVDTAQQEYTKNKYNFTLCLKRSETQKS